MTLLKNSKCRFFVGLLITLMIIVVSISCTKTKLSSSQDKTQKGNTIDMFVKEELAKGKKPNRLIDEKSPYLLQHAFNPVDWYPWGEEAFEKARQEDKPIFVSIGYSTCHWCHVMERESFENADIAAIMNKYFISIKIDREERPDVDRVYMAATQAMTGGGGWPMSVFLTHDLKPFYTGTYFPPDSRYGRPGFPDLLESIHKAWVEKRDQLTEAAEKITDYLRKNADNGASDSILNESLLQKAYGQIANSYDDQHGGFGGAPKFPRPVIFNFLLRYHKRANEQKALDITLATLRKMAEGGMNDQLGGGFHRYSVDSQWRVPHFEKMLYDQAQLVVSYLEAYQLSNDIFFADVARDVLDYVVRDMTDSKGGFHSAEDADSPLPENPDEEAEGAFYVWTKTEIETILGKETAEIFNIYYGVVEGGNALSDPQGEFVGMNILYVSKSIEDIAKQFNQTPEKINNSLSESRQTLFAIRDERPRPHLDDKVITAWNGLMIGAFAKGYQVLGETRYLDAAKRSAGFILAELYDSKKKTLLRRYRDGESGLEAHLEDYAFFVQGLLDLYEASLEINWLTHAIDLTTKQINLFWDTENNGFYDTSGNDKTVLLRTKDNYDGAEPAGNSIATMNLLRLAQMTDNEDWHNKAKQTLSAFSGRLQQIPSAMPQMITAFDYQLAKPKQIIIAGKPDASDTKRMLNEVFKRYIPNKIILLADGGEGQKILAKHLSFIESVVMIDGKATAYICENYVCQLPTSDVAVMVSFLQ